MKQYRLKSSQRKPRPVKVPDDTRARVTDKVLECLRLAEIRWNRKFQVPTIDYSLIGKAAGQANLKLWLVKLNSILLTENVEDMIDNTVPHEVAHLITYAVYGIKVQPHGREWESVMDLFGCKPERCHNYDTTRSKVYKRPRKKYIYICACEVDGKYKEWELGAKRHKKQQLVPETYYCRSCRAFLLPKEDGEGELITDS